MNEKRGVREPDALDELLARHGVVDADAYLETRKDAPVESTGAKGISREDVDAGLASLKHF